MALPSSSLMLPKTHPERPAPARGRLSWSNLNRRVILGIGGMHLVALLAIWPGHFSWSGLALFFVFTWVTAGLGITLC